MTGIHPLPGPGSNVADEVHKKEIQAGPTVRSWSMLAALGVPYCNIATSMKDEFQALSVVTALLAGIAFSLLQSPPQELLAAEDGVPFAYCIITAGALFCNLANVTFSTLLRTTVNMLVEEGSVASWFVEKYANFITIFNFMLFDLSILLLLISVLMFSFYTYSFTAGYVLIAICCAGALVIVCIYLWVDYARWYKLKAAVQDMNKGHMEECNVPKSLAP